MRISASVVALVAALPAWAAQGETVWPPAANLARPRDTAPPPPDAAESEVSSGVPCSWHPPLVPKQDNGISIWQPIVVRDGRLMVIEIAAVESCGRPRVEWAGQTFTSYPTGDVWQSLLPVRLGAEPGSHLFGVNCDGRRAGFSVDVVAGDYPETELRVKPKFSKKPPKRVVIEAATIKEALAVRTEGRRWTEAFLRPALGPTTSVFGAKRTFNGKVDSRHRGHDFDGRVGTPVVAANDGTVVLVAERYYFTGNAVFIDHGDRLFTMYFHLSRVDVETGDRVERGQVIGAIGQSGRVTGPHLHFAVKVAGSYVDPTCLLAYEPGVRLSDRAGATSR